VAVVRDNTVHLQPVVVARDYGAVTEILSGVQEGDLVVMTPNDVARERRKSPGEDFSIRPDRRPPGPKKFGRQCHPKQ